MTLLRHRTADFLANAGHRETAHSGALPLHNRRMWHPWPAVALVLSALVALPGCSSSSDSTGAVPPSASASSTGRPGPVPTVALKERQIARFHLVGQPDWLAADRHFLYVKEDSGDVVAIDPGTNRIAWRVTTTSDLCQGLGVGFGSVWTCAPDPDGDTDDVVRIDPGTHRVVSRLKVGKSNRQGRLVTGFDRGWVIRTTPAGSPLVGINPVTERADPPIPLGMLAVELTIDRNLVWAVGSVTGEVAGVDPRAAKVVQRVRGLARLGGPSLLTVGGGALLWVSGDNATAGIDRQSARVIVDVSQPTKGYGGMAATDSDLWIHSGDPFLTRIDPASGRPVERVTAPDLPNPGDVLYAFGSLWASANNQATVVRLRV